MKDLKVGGMVTITTPWKGNVIAVVLNVDSEYLDYKKQNKNFVTLYAKGYLLKAIYYSWICWKKDVNGRPYKENHSTELKNLEVIAEGVHIDTLDKELERAEPLPNGIITKCSDLDDLFDWMTCWCDSPMNGSIMVNEEVAPVEEWKSDYLIGNYTLEWVKFFRYPYCWFAVDRGCIDSTCVFAVKSPKDDMGIEEALHKSEKCLLVELPSSYSKDEVLKSLKGE